MVDDGALTAQRIRRLCLGVPIAAVAFACGADVRQAAVTDSAGIRMVRHGALSDSGQAAKLVTKEVRRIQSSDTDTRFDLGRVSSVAVSRAGTVLLFDGDEGVVRTYDSSGAFVRTVGRSGEGPGEFGAGAATVLVDASDSLRVFEPGRMRLSVFSPEGSFVRADAVHFAGWTPIRWDVSRHAVLVQLRPLALPGQPATAKGDVIVRLDASGGVADTVVRFDTGELLDLTKGPAGAEQTFFRSEPAWDASLSGALVVGHTSAYRLTAYDADARPTMIVTADVPDAPITDAGRKAYLTLYRDALSGGAAATRNPEATAMVERMVSRATFAATYPAFAAVRALEGGGFMIQRVATIESLMKQAGGLALAALRQGSPSWDVYGADGSYHGHCGFPASLRPTAIAPGGYYSLTSDERGLPAIVRLASCDSR
jgi:hypothetical protein